MIKAAKSNWPESHEFQPRNAEHLRGWLIAKAGWYDRVVVHPPPEIVSKDAKAHKQAMLWMEQSIAAVRGSKDLSWIRRYGNNIVVFSPKSIALHEMGHQEFGMLNEKVSEVLAGIIGMDGDELLANNNEVA